MDGEPRTATSTFTQLLNSEFLSSVMFLLYIHPVINVGGWVGPGGGGPRCWCTWELGGSGYIGISAS